MSYDELPGSPRESLNEGSGSTAERRFLVTWANRLTFADSFVGTTYPNFPQSRIVAIDIQPWTEDFAPDSATITDPSLVTAGYTGKPALVTLKYGPDFTQKTWPTDMPKPSFRSGTELRFRIDGSAQFLLIPYGGSKWQSDNEPLSDEELNRKIIPIREIQLQWDFVDDPPINALELLMGTVNSSVFLGCEAETLLFEGYNVEESFRASASSPHTNRITVCLRRRRIESFTSVYGWNHDWRKDPPGWDKVIMGGTPRYKPKVFTNMFA